MPKQQLNSIDYLSEQEHKIHRWTTSLLNGTRNEKDLIFKNEAVINYKAIHQGYFDILIASEDESIKLEILKRIAFLNWISMLEPDWLTGITELDESAIFNSYKILDDYVKADKLDVELTWMLKHYSSWDYIIFHYTKEKLEALNAFVASTDPTENASPHKTLPKGTMNNRGQMGIYWKQFVERTD